MIALILLFVLAWQFYIGYSRGIALQLYDSLAAVLAFLVANLYYKRLADALTLWVPYANPTEDAKMSFFQSVNLFELDRVFYAGVAFILIYLGLYEVLRFLGLLMRIMDVNRFDKKSYKWLAGGLALFTRLLALIMLLTVLATIPLPAVQNLLGGQLVFKALIHFPLISQLLHYLWVVAIL